MAKQYKSKCKKCGAELSSHVGEDLADFKKRESKDGKCPKGGGHEVGELYNSDYELSERGYKLLSELHEAIIKVEKIRAELDKEFKKIEGMATHKGSEVLPGIAPAASGASTPPAAATSGTATPPAAATEEPPV
jgi:hypothetical protein